MTTYIFFGVCNPKVDIDIYFEGLEEISFSTVNTHSEMPQKQIIFCKLVSKGPPFVS